MTTPSVSIPFNKTYISAETIDRFSLLLKSGIKQSGDGAYNKSCAEWLKNFLAADAVCLTPSCTSAMEFAYLLIDLQPGDEVIMPSFTFTSTATAVTLFGGIPVFVDVDAFLNLDLTQLDAAYSQKTRAVCAVHYAAQSCNMIELQTWCKNKNVFLIEDAAQALMSSYKNRPLGTFGDFAAFSFHETKNIICGEGGALVVNNKNFLTKVEILRDKGTNRQRFLRGEIDKYTWQDKGSSYLLSETAACLLYSQLLEADKITAKRRQILQRYHEQINPNNFFSFMELNQDNTHNGHLAYILCIDETIQKKMQAHMRDLNIQLVSHYVPLHDSPAGLKLGRTSGALTRTTVIHSRLLRLPIYFKMTEAEQASVLRGLNDFRA